MKTYFLFAMMGCTLMCGVSHADPPGNGAAPKTQTPARPASSEQARPSLKTVRNPGSGAAIIGGPTSPVKAAPSITGAVNPAKNTAAINGTGMNHKR